MTRIRMLVGLLAVALVTCGWLAAQDKKAADDKKEEPAKVKGILPKGWKQLKLADDQVQKIHTIQADYRTKIESLQKQIKESRRSKTPRWRRS